MPISHHPSSSTSPGRLARFRSKCLTPLVIAAALVCGLVSVRAADETKRSFHLAAERAEVSLKLFSEQSGRGLIAGTDVLKDVRTKEVTGDYTPAEALALMLQGTGLVATQDEPTGAFIVRRESAGPNGVRAAAATNADGRPQTKVRGEIRGQVNNAVTGAYLGSVRVRLRELNRETLTERDGSFSFEELPSGSYQISFDYPALDSQFADVFVEEGAIVRKNVEMGSDVYVMPQFVVAGQREGNAAAIAEQRYAPNVTNVLTADAFGDPTKANIGNLLRRIPGITGITDDEIDTSSIQVRGMDANLTSIDIDGTRAASAMNGSRKQNVNAIPVDLIEKVEVAKAPTAADDADSLGGRVKLTTKSAFDLRERLAVVRVGASYNETYGRTVTASRSDYVPPSFGVTFADVFDFLGKGRELGVFFTANYDKFLDARSLSQFGHVTNSGGSPSGTTTRDYSTFEFSSDELHDQRRYGASLRLEYKLGDHTVIGLSGMLSRYVDDYDRARLGFNGATINVAASDPDPNYTVVNNAAYMAQKNLRESATASNNLRLFGKTQVNGYEFIYDVSRQAAEKDDFRNQTQFISANKFSYALDWRPNPELPRPIILTGADPFLDGLTNVNSTALEVRAQNIKKDVTGARLDGKKVFQFARPITVQSGLRFREEKQTDDQERFVASLNLAKTGRDLSGLLDNDWKNGGALGYYPVSAVPSNDKVLGGVRYVGGADPRTAWQYDADRISMNASSTVQNSLLNDRSVDEKLYAYYLQGSTNFGQLNVLAGARHEITHVAARFGVRNRNAADVFDQFNGIQHAKAHYDDIFPSVHLRYEAVDGLVLRASVSTTIGRPDLEVIAGSADYNLTSRTVTIPNAELVPQYAVNYDLSAEYYFKPVGVFSVGVFQKDISDYMMTVATTISEVEAADLGVPIANPNPSALTWTRTTEMNSGDARVRGVEVSYSQQLSFLPGALRGLGVFANYTWLQTEGTIQMAGMTQQTIPLIHFIPRSGNAGLSYTYGRWDARLQANYHSKYQDGYNASNPRLRSAFRGERYQWDFNTRVKLTRTLAAFVNLSNFTTTSEASYRGWEAPERRDQTIGYSFIITGGVSATF